MLTRKWQVVCFKHTKLLTESKRLSFVCPDTFPTLDFQTPPPCFPPNFLSSFASIQADPVVSLIYRAETNSHAKNQNRRSSLISRILQRVISSSTISHSPAGKISSYNQNSWLKSTRKYAFLMANISDVPSLSSYTVTVRTPYFNKAEMRPFSRR